MADQKTTKPRHRWPRARQGHQGQEPIVVNEAAVRRTVLATAAANAMEWYDFGVYSYLAVVMGEVFFAQSGSRGLQYSLLAVGWRS